LEQVNPDQKQYETLSLFIEEHPELSLSKLQIRMVLQRWLRLQGKGVIADMKAAEKISKAQLYKNNIKSSKK
jgi:hypothetical protein